MSDTLMTIIGIFVATVLMFVFPLILFTQEMDNIAQTTVHIAVSNFVEKTTSKGEITLFDYNQMMQKLYSTGCSYDIQIGAKIIDDNPRRVTATAYENKLLGECEYFSVYTNTILDALQNEQKNNKYELKNDDYVTVTVKNTSETLAAQLSNIFYKIRGNEAYAIGTSVSSTVLKGATTGVEPKTTMKSIVKFPVSI